MKNIIQFLVLLSLSLFLLPNTQADYRFYTAQAEFEKNEGETCQSAIDGCNTYFVVNGKIAGGTKMYCGADFQPKWECRKTKGDIMTTKLEEPSICTMEYAPVCGVDGITYGNKCGANAAKVEIKYEGECKSNLSDNDLNYYHAIQNKLDQKYIDIVAVALKRYESKIAYYSVEKKNRITKKMIRKIEKEISKLLEKYPQDIALPKNASNKYLTYTLLKLELMQLEY